VGKLRAPIMSTISTQLRNFKEPTKEQLTEIFFSIPPAELSSTSNGGTPIEKLSNEEPDKMEINAVLSLGVQGEEDSYVSILLRLRLDNQ
jgi:TBC1 domain family member 8/9